MPAERMNARSRDATVKVFHYDDLHGPMALVLTFVPAYNFAKHLKAPGNGKHAIRSSGQTWTKVPVIFRATELVIGHAAAPT